MNDSLGKLSLKEKVGYSLGDVSANFVFQTLLVFQLNFYTDTFGLSAAAAGTLFFVAVMGGAIFDPIMGVVSDRTTTKWGKFRPWILWTAVPFGILTFLTFSTPNFGPAGKLIYAYTTFILLMMMYSANNVPYSALSAVMTGDSAQRTSLLSYRQVFANSAAFIVQGLSIPMRTFFGGGDSASAKGWATTMGIFAVLCVVFFVIAFLSTKERIQPDPSQKTSLGQDLRDLTKNGPYIALFVMTVFLFIALPLRGSMMNYYFKYCLNNESLFSLFNVFGLASVIVGILFSTALATRFGKRSVYIAGLSTATVLTALLLVLPSGAIIPIFVVEVVRQFAYGWTCPLLWAMVADVADYSEWKTGRRATGMVSAAIVFGLKVGLGFGLAVGGWLLSLYGYDAAAAVQSEEALTGIRMASSVFPALAFLAGVVCLFFYKIDKRLNLQITNELTERRKTFGTNPRASTA